MRIAIASGKGGTGKTTIATGLALSAREGGLPVAYVDCDVEEPNGHVLLRPDLGEPEVVTAATPVIDASRCTLCGRCVGACRFNALALAAGTILTFPELCHACEACSIVCPEEAVAFTGRRVGVVESGDAGGIAFVRGVLDVGEAMPTPVLRAVTRRLPDRPLVLLDAPPGTSCPVVETLRSADAALLVVEPTPFGLHDFSLAAELVRELGMPCLVVLNKSDGSDSGRAAAAAVGLEVVAEFREDRAVAEAYSRGEHPFGAVEGFRREMLGLAASLEQRLGSREAS